MFKEVVIKAFKKAEKEIAGRKSRNSTANRLSEELLNEFQYSMHARTLIDLHKASISCSEKEDISINSEYVEKLCAYLGFNSYQEFLGSRTAIVTNINGEKSFNLTTVHKVIIGLIILGLIIVSTVFYLNRERWMEWDVDHYIEASFNAKKIQNGDLKVYKEERIVYFKKIPTDCSTSFFNTDGSVKIWYGKNKKGMLEYFTDLGKHPVTGKTLRPITEYMIRTHICESF